MAKVYRSEHPALWSAVAIVASTMAQSPPPDELTTSDYYSPENVARAEQQMRSLTTADFLVMCGVAPEDDVHHSSRLASMLCHEILGDLVGPCP